MQSIKTMGIVIRATTVGDYDKMLTVLSAELGRISVWAKGAKSQKHDAHSSMSPLCYSEFVLNPKGDVYTLSSATLNSSFYGLRNSVESLAYAMYFASLAESLSPQGVEADEMLRLLLNCLYFLEKELKDRADLRLCFELKALELSGLAPVMDGCFVCGREDALWLEAEGGTVCDGCRSARAKKITPEARELMEFYTLAPLKEALYRKGAPDAAAEGVRLCEELVRHHVGRVSGLDYLKSVT